MKRNLFPLLGIAFVVALAASGIFYGLFISQFRQAYQAAVKRSIVVAAKPLDRGTVLKAGDVKLSPWAGVVPPGSLAHVEDATGKTLYSSMDENEPLTETRVSPNHLGSSLGVAQGMRALSVHLVDSTGLLPYLHPGTHVDVQAVRNRSTPGARLRTVLENVEVLSVQAQEGQNQWATLTLLANPGDSDRLALADSGANIRVLLRNPLDPAVGTRPAIHMEALFDDSDPLHREQVKAPQGAHQMVRASSRPSAAEIPISRSTEPCLELVVRVGGASPHAMEDVLAGIHGFRAGRSMQVITLPPEEGGQRFWASLEQKHHVELFSLSHVIAANESGRRMQIGKAWKAASGTGGFCVRFHWRLGPHQTLQLRLQPEVSLPDGLSGVVTRKVATDLTLEEGQCVIVTGLSEPNELPTLADRLFSGRIKDASHGDLFVLVTPHLIKTKNPATAGGR